MEKKKGFHYGFVIVAAEMIQYLFCGGIIYGACGVFIAPVTKSLSISQGQFMLYMTFINGALAITATFLAPKLIGKFSYRKLNAVAVVVASAGLALMGFAQKTFVFYIAGILMGFGSCFITALAAGILIPRWFKLHQGTMIATVLLGSRFGGMVFNPVVSALINSEPLFGMAESWRSTYVSASLLLLMVGLVNSLLILRDYPKDKGLRPVWDEVSVKTEGKVLTSGVDARTAKRSAAFVFLVCAVIMWTLVGTLINYLAAYASGTPASSTSSIDLVGLIGTFSMAGALAGGYILGGANDKFGGAAGCLIAGISGATGLVVLLLGQNSSVMILSGAFLFGIFFAIAGVQINAMVSTLFGMREYDKIFQAANQFQPWFGAISASMWGFVYDINKSYTLSFIIATVLCVLTSVFGLLSVAASKKLKSAWTTETSAQ